MAVAVLLRLAAVAAAIMVAVAIIVAAVATITVVAAATNPFSVHYQKKQSAKSPILQGFLPIINSIGKSNCKYAVAFCFMLLFRFVNAVFCNHIIHFYVVFIINNLCCHGRLISNTNFNAFKFC